MGVPHAVIETYEDLVIACDYFAKCKAIGLDVETTELEPRDGELRLIQLSEGRKAALIDRFALLENMNLREAPLEQQWEAFTPLKKLLEAKKPIKIIHTAKFESKWLAVYCNIQIDYLFDTFLAAQLVDYNSERDPAHGHSLAAVAMRYLGVNLDKTEQTSDWGAPVLSESQIEYAALDVFYSPRLREILRQRLVNSGQTLTAKIEFDCAPVLAHIEMAGLKVNRGVYTDKIKNIENLRDFAAKNLQDLLRQTQPKSLSVSQGGLFEGISEINYSDVLLTSADKIRKAYAKLGVPILTKAQGAEVETFKKSGKKFANADEDPKVLKKLVKEMPNMKNFYDGLLDRKGKTFHEFLLEFAIKPYVTSTGAKELKPLQNDYPALTKLAEHRSTEKLVSSYGESFLAHLKTVVPAKNRLHAPYYYEVDSGRFSSRKSNIGEHERVFPTFYQIGAPTGRMACKNPNVQQVPDKGIKVGGEDHAPLLRLAMDAPDGYKLLIADYSQIELRVLADITGDPVFMEAFVLKRDLHSDTASKVFKKDYAIFEDKKHELHKEYQFKYRKPAKNMNFGIVYGISKYGLASMIDQSEDEAQKMIDLYAETYPVMWNWLLRQAKNAVATLEARTLSGRLQKFTPPTKDIKGMPNKSEVGLIGRNGRNMPIQGTAADIFKRSLRLIFDGIKGYDARIVNVVHDEVVIEVHESVAEILRPKVEEWMKAAAYEFLKKVPIEVEAKVVSNWGGK